MRTPVAPSQPHGRHHVLDSDHGRGTQAPHAPCVVDNQRGKRSETQPDGGTNTNLGQPVAIKPPVVSRNTVPGPAQSRDHDVIAVLVDNDGKQLRKRIEGRWQAPSTKQALPVHCSVIK